MVIDIDIVIVIESVPEIVPGIGSGGVAAVCEKRIKFHCGMLDNTGNVPLL